MGGACEKKVSLVRLDVRATSTFSRRKEGVELEDLDRSHLLVFPGKS